MQIFELELCLALALVDHLTVLVRAFFVIIDVVKHEIGLSYVVKEAVGGIDWHLIKATSVYHLFRRHNRVSNHLLIQRHALLAHLLLHEPLLLHDLGRLLEQLVLLCRDLRLI